MNNYRIYFLDNLGHWTELGKVSGAEATYRAYKKACKLARIFGKACALVDDSTGEIIDISDEEDE